MKSSLPLLFKKEGLIEKHQIEGVAPSDRYFNRMILVNRTASGYTAKIMYEARGPIGITPTVPVTAELLPSLVHTILGECIKHKASDHYDPH
ncbi:MAG: hypothetical protein E8D41_12505 [Nitrospira sp.]|nr:MAG: hypothetical protein E8D41_12505 [Nitrospira sp.]